MRVALGLQVTVTANRLLVGDRKRDCRLCVDSLCVLRVRHVGDVEVGIRACIAQI